MATTKLLQLRPKLKPYSSLKFSSSSTSNSNPDQTETPPSEPQQTPTPKPFSFSSIANKPQQTPTPKPFSFSSIANKPQNPSSESYDFSEAKKTLAEFRLRTGSVPSPSPSPSTLSFQEIFKKNFNNIRSEATPRPTPAGKLDFNALRAKLGNKNSQDENRGKMFDPLSLSRYQDSFKLRPNIDKDVKGSGMVIGGSGNLPSSIFGKDMHMRDKEGDNERMRTEFLRSYTYVELGKKLKMLRSIKKGEKGWFSLHELNNRLMKVRKADENDSKSAVGGLYTDIKESLYILNKGGDAKPKKTMIQRLDVLGQLGGTPNFMLHPPKEHLVEKFFHPDNMSSAEKMKVELQKVRDEFKMSESDCGSARVQVAQLTTKIKHLSAVLHKKDKHSRKGLQQMVQNRKKLLKYLRRTDWDSYCLVLSKLGLRDNPDYKF